MPWSYRRHPSAVLGAPGVGVTLQGKALLLLLLRAGVTGSALPKTSLAGTVGPIDRVWKARFFALTVILRSSPSLGGELCV